MKTYGPGIVQTLVSLAAIVCGAGISPFAAAQHNSLFPGSPAASQGDRAQSGSTPAAQNGASAGAAADSAKSGAVVGPNARNGKSGGRAATGNLAVLSPDLPAVNETLLNVSPIAVELPKTRERRINVHDLVTIIVREDKRHSTKSKLEQDKNWDIATALTEWIRIDEDEHLVPQNFTRGRPSVDFRYEDKYDGEGKIDRSDTLTMRITAEVIDVKPNGTLVLEARKSIAHDDETQVMKLTGICRADDITPENTVLSTQVADLSIDVDNDGAARDASKRGRIKKFVDLLNLF